MTYDKEQVTIVIKKSNENDNVTNNALLPNPIKINAYKYLV